MRISAPLYVRNCLSILATGAQTYENLLPCLTLGAFSIISSKFVKITANEKMIILTTVIHRKKSKGHFSYTQFEHFFHIFK